MFYEILNKKYDKIIILPNFYYFSSILAFFFLPKNKRILWGIDLDRGLIVNKLRLIFAKKANSIIQYNKRDLSKLLNNNIKRDKIFISNNTLHVENHMNTSKMNKSSFVYVGRLQARKKIKILFYAFQSIINKIPKNINLEIVGDGLIKDKLILIAKNLNISERVIFHGKITNDKKLIKIFSRSFAYISPDAIGLGLQHSFSYGVPVITCKNGFKGPEFFHLINLENSILFDDEADLSRILIEIVENKIDVKKISDNSYNYFLKNLSIQNMFNQFNKAINYDNM